MSGHELLTLSGNELRFSVSPASGGEIQSLQRLWRGAWIELLYHGQEGWRGGAPWLFPAVGRSASARGMGFWRHGAKDYPMPIHGFAMSQAWDGTLDRGAIVCKTKSSAETRVLYPFDFELRAEYSLMKNGLRARLEVSASRDNREPMPFSVGNHLTLKLPSKACRVRTSAQEEALLTDSSLLSGEKSPVNYQAGVALGDAPRLLDCVLGKFPSSDAWAELVDLASFGVRVGQKADNGASAEHFHFVFYGDIERGFFCPEPWYGGPNSLNELKGVVSLKPGARFGWEMTLEMI